MRRLSEEFGVAPIAELVDLPDRAPAVLAGIVTALRVRTTKKGERMAWLTLADATGAVEAAVFPRAYDKSGIAAALREGAFLVVRGRLAHEEATGTKVFIDEVTPMAGRGTRLSAIAVAVEERRGEAAPWANPGYRG
jgi:DNA polymerase-3 subunit alpha